MVSNRQLANHFAAHAQCLSKDHRHEAASAVREVAISLALEVFGTNEEHAVKWLERCQVTYPTARYRKALDELRHQAALNGGGQ